MASEASRMSNTNSDDAPKNLTAGPPHAAVVSEAVDRFDRELEKWFALHGGGPWSGTAAELFAALGPGVDASSDWWPQSTTALYGHIESHRQELHSLGLAVLQPPGYPRMIYIRAYQDEQRRKFGASDVSLATETVSQESPTARSDANNLTECACDQTAETLIAMLRTPAAPESTTSNTMSKLAAAPRHLRTALKRVWTRRPRAL